MTVKLPVYNLKGEVVRQIEINDDVFAVPFNQPVVHQALLRQRANARQGTASAKTRSEVIGSQRKPFHQKGTGNARAGSSKSPLRRGGGVTFGPKPRDYRQAMPKKMRRLAIRCLLSAKAESGELKILDELKMTEAKAREMAAILKALGVASSTLIATERVEEKVVKSARNLSKVKTTPANQLNVVDLLTYDTLLMTESAVHQVEGLWGGKPQGEDDASV
ncbi:MAG: 50S ribosomal protein L4 [Dehalococcoidales bacterium]